MDLILSLLSTEFLGKSVGAWLLFLGVIAVLLAFDLGVLHRKQREVGFRESLWLSAGYVAVALAFGAWLWWTMGQTAGMAYFTGYFIEKSLSLDNVFVIALIFGYFAVPRSLQHRVLFWGVLGAIALRGIMILLGAVLVSRFGWVLYLFGAFLLVTGVQMLLAKERRPDLADNAVIRFVRRHLNVTSDLHRESFFVRLPDPAEPGRTALFATPLFLALMLVEAVDLIFAVDSVPAIFAITTDPYIVYTSNIFAILGLRSLYFALAFMIHRFRYLKQALALVLIFIGVKIFWTHLVGEVHPGLSLGVTLALLVGGVLASLWRTREERDLRPDAEAHSAPVGC